MKKSTGYFTLKNNLQIAVAAAYLAFALAPSWFIEDLSLKVSERFGNDMAIQLGVEECQGKHPSLESMAGKELREQRVSLVECISAWSYDTSEEKMEDLGAWLSKNLVHATSRPLGTLSIGMVDLRDKAIALSAFKSARPAQDASGGLKLMSLVSLSQQGASSEEAAAAAAKARALLPQIKSAAIKERREAVDFVNHHAFSAAAFLLLGRGPLEEAIAPSIGSEVLSAYWMTQNFEELSKIKHPESNEGKRKLAELREKAKVWADSEWASLISESDAGSDTKFSKA